MAKNGWLSNVATTAPSLPSRIVMYAPEGFGKTSFAAMAVKPVFFMAANETGLLTLLDAGRLPPTPHMPAFHSWTDLREATQSLISGDHNFGTYVLDTGNSGEQLCCSHTADVNFGGNLADYASYGKGDVLAAKEWASYLAQLDQLRERRKMAIIILHHARVKGVVKPDHFGKDYDQWRPESVDKLWSQTHKWADVILFGGSKVNVQKEKAVSEQRYLRCTPTAAIVAKNRYGLPDEITGNGQGAAGLWKAFADAMRKAKANGKVAKEPGQSLPITPDQAKELIGLIEAPECQINLSTVLEKYDLGKIEDLPSSKYDELSELLLKHSGG